MTEQADEGLREFMASRWPGMVRLAYGLTGDQGHAARRPVASGGRVGGS